MAEPRLVPHPGAAPECPSAFLPFPGAGKGCLEQYAPDHGRRWQPFLGNRPRPSGLDPGGSGAHFLRHPLGHALFLPLGVVFIKCLYLQRYA